DQRLEATEAPGFEIGTDLQRQVQAISALSAQLGLSFDAGIAQQNRRAAELDERKLEIDKIKLDIELAQMQQRLDKSSKGEDPVADFVFLPPKFEDADYRALYYRWLEHLTHRLNAISAEAREDQLADRQLQFLGTATKLFAPVTFYVSSVDVDSTAASNDNLGS